MPADEQLYALTAERVREFTQLLAWAKNFRGQGVRNTPFGASVYVPQLRRRVPTVVAGVLVVVVKLTAAEPGSTTGGKYTARVLTGRSTATGSGNLNMPEGMTVPAADDALVLNLAEDDEATHVLSAGEYHIGLIVGVTTEATPRKIVAIDVLPDPHFTARIATATRVTDGSPTNWAWNYTYVEVAKTGAGYGGWTDKAGGRSGSSWNRIEDQNTGAGVIGNGVDVDNLDTDEATFTPQPCPVGTRVEMTMVPVVGGTSEAWFQYESGIDGVCDTPGTGDYTIDGGSWL